MKKLLYLFSILIFSCSSEKSSPNFIVIIVDDLGINDLGSSGSKFYETPNIDYLRSISYSFENAYSNSNVCSPSRASILTGLNPVNHNITSWIRKESINMEDPERKLIQPNFAQFLNHDFLTIPDFLKGKGYETFFAGKWHLGNSENQSLPENFSFDYNIGGTEDGYPAGGYFPPYNNKSIENGTLMPDENLSIRLAKETNNFIEDHAEENFLAFLSFYAVHSPIETTNKKFNKYRKKAIKLDYDKAFEKGNKLPYRIVQDNPIYAGLLEQVDDAVGMLLNTLEKNKLLENTVIIFLSDNGGVVSGDNYSTSNLPYKGGKGQEWEGGYRIPFFIHLPGQLKQRKIDSPVITSDILPTIMALTSDNYNENQFEGKSLLPLIKGIENKKRTLFFHSPHYTPQGGVPNSIIIEDNFKLIHNWENGNDLLYNLREIPRENASVNDSVKNKLSKKLMVWLAENNAKLPYPNYNYRDSISIIKKSDSIFKNLTKKRNEILDLNYTYK